LNLDSIGKTLLLFLFVAGDVTPCLRFGLPRPQARASYEAGTRGGV
jgi:hypothetical protein